MPGSPCCTDPNSRATVPGHAQAKRAMPSMDDGQYKRHASQTAHELLGRPAGPAVSAQDVTVGYGTHMPQPMGGNVFAVRSAAPTVDQGSAAAHARTFADMAMRVDEDRDEDAENDERWRKRLLDVDKRQSNAAVAHAHSLSDAGGTSCMGPPLQPQEMVTTHCLPYDWALKSSARFACAVRFPCVDAAALLPHSTLLQLLIDMQSNTNFNGWASCPPEARWPLGLVSWRFPDASWEPGMVTAVTSASHPVIAERASAWRRALTSAYSAMRHRRGCALYVSTPPGTPRPCTVLFTGPDVHGCRLPQALLSCTSRTLRARLQAAGLEFHMPLAAGSTARARGGSCASVDPSTVLSASAAVVVRDYSPQSAVLLSGPLAVHQLLDCLLADYSLLAAGQAMAAVGDVPVVMAPVMFEGAVPWRPGYKWSNKLMGQGQQYHELEVGGPLPPWTLTRMCDALAESAAPQGLGFQVELATLEHCLSLNCEAVGQRVSRGGSHHGASVCWALSTQEWHAACDPPGQLYARVVQHVVMEPSTVESRQEAGSNVGAAPRVLVTYKMRLSG